MVVPKVRTLNSQGIRVSVASWDEGSPAHLVDAQRGRRWGVRHKRTIVFHCDILAAAAGARYTPMTPRTYDTVGPIGARSTNS